MTRPRIVETDGGIVGEVTVAQYDEMQRTLRDRGWIETRALLDAGIDRGLALELGPGPGYLGLEWLRRTRETRLVGLDISADMLARARRNAETYGLTDRVEYRLGDGSRLPFEDRSFDAVFTNGSLHEWAKPQETFAELGRVLRPGGRFLVSDLRRDMAAPVRWFLWLMTRPTAIRPGLLSSIGAAYTPTEVAALLAETPLARARVASNPVGLTISGTLPADAAG
ncbi:MAG: class I SAM-dependent methyltransferase [Deltaproteobacteria bacterium]|nr:class I SAM-dependent methyltransferase [Deltaproteobacteria bacterium]